MGTLLVAQKIKNVNERSVEDWIHMVIYVEILYAVRNHLVD